MQEVVVACQVKAILLLGNFAREKKVEKVRGTDVLIYPVHDTHGRLNTYDICNIHGNTA